MHKYICRNCGTESFSSAEKENLTVKNCEKCGGEIVEMEGEHMNADEIVSALRNAADRWEKRHPVIGVGELRVQDALRDSADAIESLKAKLAEVTAECDAAVEDIEAVLKQDWDADKCWACTPEFDCGKERRCSPTWRGPQESEKGEAT